MSAAHTKLEFHAVREGSTDCLAILVLNRPSHANSFSAQMMEEITFHLETVGRRDDCRCLLITGAGRHFSGGADLSWMQASAKLSYNENIKDAARLTSMFESVYHLEIPTVAAIRGAVYGGALGLIACCDFAVAHDQARFCLSEAKLGLLPAVIMPYLARKMRPGQLRRHSLTGRIFSALEAQQYGLIEVIAGDDFSAVLRQELNNVLSCGPDAQRAIKSLLDRLRGDQFPQSDITQQAISKARSGVEGQAGLAAFFNKTPAPWLASIPNQLVPDASSLPLT